MLLQLGVTVYDVAGVLGASEALLSDAPMVIMRMTISAMLWQRSSAVTPPMKCP